MTVEIALLPRRERRKLELRGRMLGAAVALFDAQGIEATTVGEICERADVAEKTFFNHFPSKRHLIREIALEGLAQLHLGLEEAGKLPGPPRERIASFFDWVAANGEEGGPLHRELLTEVIHAVHESGEEPELARRLRAAFADLVRGGENDAFDEATRTEMVMGVYYVLMFNWAHLEGYPLRERAHALASSLADAFASQERR
jgi:AcrR family transcriptional regulator